MRAPRQHNGVRFAAYAVLIVIVTAVLTVSVMNLRDSAELRARIQGMEARSEQRDSRLQTEFQGISQRLDDLPGGMRTEIAAARRGARGEVGRLGSRLSGKLDEMASQLKSTQSPAVAAKAPEPAAAAAPIATPAPEPVTTPASAPVTAPAPAPVAAPAPATPDESQASATDLLVIRQVKQAKALFEAGKYAQAQKVFHAALALQPDNMEARLYYAASLFRASPADASAYPTIEKNLRFVLSSDGEDPLALEILGMVAMERQKWTEATDYLRRLIVVRPENERFLKTAGYCALKTGDIEGARDYFMSAVDHAPSDGEASSMLGDCESRLGNAEKAEESWKSALSTIDITAAGGARASVTLREKLAGSLHDRGAYEESLSYARQKDQESVSDLLRVYEGLSTIGLGRTGEGLAILKAVASSTDQRAASLAEKGLKESGE